MFSDRNDIVAEERDQKINFLVREILAGRQDLIYELWELLEGLCSWYCRRLYRQLPATFKLEFDDLFNCGFIALHEALSHCSEEKIGRFSTYYTFFLVSTIFRENALTKGGHYKDGRRRFDPVITDATLSLDATVEGNDGKSDSLHNFLGDKHVLDYSVDTIAEAEERIFHEQLHEALEVLIAELPEDEQFLIRQKYYVGQDCIQIATQLHISQRESYQLEDRALIALRRRGELCGLEQYINDRISYYTGTGIKRFRESEASAVERLVIRREELEDRYKQLYGGDGKINNGECR